MVKTACFSIQNFVYCNCSLRLTIDYSYCVHFCYREVCLQRSSASYAAWCSALPLWPSRTTRAKFMPRIWEKTILHHLEVSKIRLGSVEFGFSPLWAKPLINTFQIILVSAPVVESTSPVALPSVNTVQNPISQEQSDTSGLADQEVDLNDPNKYCALCSASFNNPLVAQQHYSGRKHQRNQSRQEMLDQMGEQSEHGIH